MPPGTTLGDVIASSLLLCNRDKSYWPVPIGRQIRRQSESELNKKSWSSQPPLWSFPVCKYIKFSVYFKEGKESVSVFHRSLSWRSCYLEMKIAIDM